jgi:hypothetical protein
LEVFEGLKAYRYPNGTIHLFCPRDNARRFQKSAEWLAPQAGMDLPSPLPLDGLPPHAWAPASGFFETTDGWARTHANYPHHASALERLLQLPTGAGREEVANALRRHTTSDWEE